MSRLLKKLLTPHNKSIPDVAKEENISDQTLYNWLKQAKSSGGIVSDMKGKPENYSAETKLAVVIETASMTELKLGEYWRSKGLYPEQIANWKEACLLLADNKVYLASESSFYRLLNDENQLHHRGRARQKQKRNKPTTYIAKSANEVWSWDISYLPSQIRGLFFYLYLIIDIYSRKIVGWEVHEHEGGDEAAELIHKAVLREQCFLELLVLHADNGSLMKSQTMRMKLYDPGITVSHSRPRVSNDNPYSEAIFRMLKYNPQWPSSDFLTIDDARQ